MFEDYCIMLPPPPFSVYVSKQINSTKADGVYGIGEQIYIDVYMSTPVVSDRTGRAGEPQDRLYCCCDVTVEAQFSTSALPANTPKVGKLGDRSYYTIYTIIARAETEEQR